MPKLADLKIGYQVNSILPLITREMIREYGIAGGDQNVIHMDDKAGEKFGLKGVIGHGLMNYGNMIRIMDDWIGDDGKILEISVQFRGIYRPGDAIIMTGKISKINGNIVDFELEQKSKTPLYIEKDGKKVKSFEADERGWLDDKDIQNHLIFNEDVKEGKFFFRLRTCTVGTAQIELFK